MDRGAPPNFRGIPSRIGTRAHGLCVIEANQQFGAAKATHSRADSGEDPKPDFPRVDDSLPFLRGDPRSLEQWFHALVGSGGPIENRYAELDTWIDLVHAGLQRGELTREQVDGWIAQAGEEYLEQTLQGHGYRQPRGYAGDYQMIDRIYRGEISSNPGMVAWDAYFHQHAAPRAVRNRKKYFQTLAEDALARTDGDEVQILNLGCGPGRDVLEFLEAHPQAAVRFVCVDQDSDALEHVEWLCREHPSRIELQEENLLRYRTDQRFDLVWCAGVADYLEDALLLRLLRRACSWRSPRGEVAVGNFSDRNPSRAYMEVLGRWYLEHRGAHELLSIAREAGFNQGEVRLGAEELGVNLFLHVVPRG